MNDKIEHLVREAESDINSRSKKNAKKDRSQIRLPKFSVAMVIWLVAILLAAFQFESVVSTFSEPTENEIQSDLEGILTTAAGTIRSYEISNGSLPPLLPNPAIRGLVKYEQINAVRFRLEATIGDVTVELDSSSLHPNRIQGPQ
jgi:hypothetical protein